MQKYLADAKALARQGKHEEALKRFVWFHNHALEHEPAAMYGVRLSFALSSWKELADKYPPALAAMQKIRDDKTLALQGGKGDVHLFHDVCALNRKLGEKEKALALFRELDQKQKTLAENCWKIIKREAIKAKAWDLVRKYTENVKREFSEIKTELEELLTITTNEKHGEHIKPALEDSFVKGALDLIETALALDDEKATREIREEALAAVDDYRLRDAVVTKDKPDSKNPPGGQHPAEAKP